MFGLKYSLGSGPLQYDRVEIYPKAGPICVVRIEIYPKVGPTYAYQVGLHPSVKPNYVFGMWYFGELTKLYAYSLCLWL